MLRFLPKFDIIDHRKKDIVPAISYLGTHSQPFRSCSNHMTQKIFHFLKTITIVLLTILIALAPDTPVLGLFGLQSQSKVQAATTAPNPGLGQSGTIPNSSATWSIGTDGKLTVKGTLPANTGDSPTFWPWTIAGANPVITSVDFSAAKPPTSAAPASIAYLFANLPKCTTINAPGAYGNGFTIGASNQDQSKLFDGDYSLLSGTVGSFSWSVDKTGGTLTLSPYNGLLCPLSNSNDDRNFWPCLQVDPNKSTDDPTQTYNSIKTISISNGTPVTASAQNQSSKESWSWLFGNLPNLTTIPTLPSFQADGVVDISYMFASD